MVATEYGIANLSSKTLRERAQALIDIAHPDDRSHLVERAKAERILYADQIFLAACAAVDPQSLDEKAIFKNGTAVRFRSIRPSDEEQMRRLFYRFSEESVYYRYFSPIHAMPHEKMQVYVNADCSTTLSIVGITGIAGRERIIAEARYVRDRLKSEAEVAFVVDDAYHGLGIATYLFKKLVTLARQNGIHTLTANVLTTNRAMMTVFERGAIPIDAKLMDGVYVLSMHLDEDD
jgi:RimJ/RimL family protein N-acetyltransferase